MKEVHKYYFLKIYEFLVPLSVKKFEYWRGFLTSMTCASSSFSLRWAQEKLSMWTRFGYPKKGSQWGGRTQNLHKRKLLLGLKIIQHEGWWRLSPRKQRELDFKKGKFHEEVAHWDAWIRVLFGLLSYLLHSWICIMGVYSLSWVRLCRVKTKMFEEILAMLCPGRRWGRRWTPPLADFDEDR